MCRYKRKIISWKLDIFYIHFYEEKNLQEKRQDTFNYTMEDFLTQDTDIESITKRSQILSIPLNDKII